MNIKNVYIFLKDLEMLQTKFEFRPNIKYYLIRGIVNPILNNLQRLKDCILFKS
jgi:hypothetical protein